MPHDNPDLPGLLVTAREFIEDLVARLDGQDRYHALCTIYLLEIASRELASEWKRGETLDDRRLRELAAVPAATAPDAMLRSLCRDIRAGRYDSRLDELLELLTLHAVAKVQIAKPAALAPEHCAAVAAGESHE